MHIIPIFKHALLISFFVFVMMLIVDFIDIITNRRASNILQGSRWRQYTLASFLGATPGCLGAFMNVTLYVHGIISFGALVGGMIATSGDEAFVMLAQFPVTAIALFISLFLSGIIFAWISDKIMPHTGIKTSDTCVVPHCEECLPLDDKRGHEIIIFRVDNLIKNFQNLSFARFLLTLLLLSFLILIMMGNIGPSTWNWERITFMSLALCAIYITSMASEHYLESHIWQHIIKKHLFRIFLWALGALLLVHWGLSCWNLDTFVPENIGWVLLIGALIGIIPESGPHLIFVMMYAKGLIPFSVLFTSSFVQDGHAMLPLLSYSLKDYAVIKFFNLVFGLSVGYLLFILGF